MRARRFELAILLALVVEAGCKQQNGDYCCTIADACAANGGDGVMRECSDPDRPFCDNYGDHPASGGVGRTCIPLPGDPCGEGDACEDPETPICLDGLCV